MAVARGVDLHLLNRGKRKVKVDGAVLLEDLAPDGAPAATGAKDE